MARPASPAPAWSRGDVPGLPAQDPDPQTGGVSRALGSLPACLALLGQGGPPCLQRFSPVLGSAPAQSTPGGVRGDRAVLRGFSANKAAATARPPHGHAHQPWVARAPLRPRASVPGVSHRSRRKPQLWARAPGGTHRDGCRPGLQTQRPAQPRRRPSAADTAPATTWSPRSRGSGWAGAAETGSSDLSAAGNRPRGPAAPRGGERHSCRNCGGKGRHGAARKRGTGTAGPTSYGKTVPQWGGTPGNTCAAKQTKCPTGAARD